MQSSGPSLHSPAARLSTMCMHCNDGDAEREELQGELDLSKAQRYKLDEEILTMLKQVSELSSEA